MCYVPPPIYLVSNDSDHFHISLIPVYVASRACCHLLQTDTLHTRNSYKVEKNMKYLLLEKAG